MTSRPNRGQLAKGVDLFNRARFFEAHEVLEDLWRSAPKDHVVRRHLQGMVQLAVAFHHESTGNHVGAGSVLARALRNLSGAESSLAELDFVRLRGELALWQRNFIGDGPRPKPPRITVMTTNARSQISSCP